eukprot:scaffold1097_cov67-Phaeocystis_antarctica.AAC.3
MPPVPGDAVCSARAQESTRARSSPSHSVRRRTKSSRGSPSSAQCLFMLTAASAASTRRAAAPRSEAREAASPGRRSSSSCEMAAHAVSRWRRTSSSWPALSASGPSGPRPRLRILRSRVATKGERRTFGMKTTQRFRSERGKRPAPPPYITTLVFPRQNP